METDYKKQAKELFDQYRTVKTQYEQQRLRHEQSDEVKRAQAAIEFHQSVINSRYESQVKPLEEKVAELEEKLKEVAALNNAIGGDNPKGVIVAWHEKYHYHDEAGIVNWLKQHDKASLVRVKEEIDKVALKKEAQSLSIPEELLSVTRDPRVTIKLELI